MLQLLTKKNRKGFTLIELLVVIAIIGILATIVLVSLNTARVKARDARRSSDMHQVALAMEMYYDSNNSAYLSSATMPTTITNGTNVFMAALPTNPGGSAGAYTWVDNTGNTAKYLICAPLESGSVGYVYSNQNGTKTVTTGNCPTALE